MPYPSLPCNNVQYRGPKPPTVEQEIARGLDLGYIITKINNDFNEPISFVPVRHKSHSIVKTHGHDPHFTFTFDTWIVSTVYTKNIYIILYIIIDKQPQQIK